MNFTTNIDDETFDIEFIGYHTFRIWKSYYRGNEHISRVYVGQYYAPYNAKGWGTSGELEAKIQQQPVLIDKVMRFCERVWEQRAYW